MSIVFAGYKIEKGTPVIARDGTEIGSVFGEEKGKLRVDVAGTDRHLLFPQQAISLFDQDYVMVDLTPEVIRTGNWGQDTKQHRTTTDASHLKAGPDGKTVIEIHEEELTAAKRKIAHGLVTVHKRVVSEEKTFEVPLTEEHVHVVRTDRNEEVPAGATDDLFREQTYEMELMGEEAHLNKKVRISGEVDIDKERVERTKTLTGTVRHEEVDVEEKDYDELKRAKKA